MEPENDNSLNNDQGVEDTATDTDVDVEALKKRAEELEQTNRQLFERAKKAEGFVKVDGKWVKAPKAEEAVAAIQKAEATTGELQEAQLDFFELKGYADEDEVAIFQNIMKRTGMSHREVIKDEYALSRINAIRQEKEVRNATPTSSKRNGQSETNSIDYWIAENERSGKLPDDFETRVAVIEAKEKRQGNDRVPPWKRK